LVVGAPTALDYRAAFQKELDTYLVKLQQPSAGSQAKRDPTKLAQMKSFAEEFQDGICRRFAQYISDSGINEVTFQPGCGGIDASHCVAEDSSESAKRARVEDLRAELRRKSAEEDRLRSEYHDQMKAQIDECWRCGDMELDNVRKDALASASQVESSNASEKAELLKLSLEQLQAQMSETGSMVAKLEQEAKNLYSIEKQHSQPRPLVEELFRGASGKDLVLPGEERTKADITRMHEVNERWRQEFDKHVL